MATQTPNLDLTKQTTTENYDIGVVNANLDKIDEAVGTANTNIAANTADIAANTAAIQANADDIQASKWVLLGTTTGNYNFAEYDEIAIRVTGNSGTYSVMYNIPVVDLTNELMFYMAGATTVNIYSNIYISKTELQGVAFFCSAANGVTSFAVYGKK